MRQVLILTLISFVFLTGCDQHTALNHTQQINPVIGDISFIEKFGLKPDQSTGEKLRIQTHLAYVEQQLRQKAVSHLSPDLRKKRLKLLDLLREYRQAGEFPANYDYPGDRKPCFIDKKGNICAVGYLVEQTAGRKLAEKINAFFQYAKIYEMDLPELLAWVAESGFTLEECAMIQPMYGNNDNFISTEYGLTTALLGGVNASMITLNSIDLAAAGNIHSTKPIIGLVSGGVSTTLGLLNYDWNPGFNTGFNATNQAVSMFNIGFGTATMIVSGYALLKKPVPENSPMIGWNVFSYPTPDNQTGVGVAFTKQF